MAFKIGDSVALKKYSKEVGKITDTDPNNKMYHHLVIFNKNPKKYHAMWTSEDQLIAKSQPDSEEE